MSSPYSLVFAPIFTMDGAVQAFDVYLKTGAHHASVIYTIGYRSGWYEEGVLDGEANSLLKIHRLGFDTMNEYPVYTLNMELAEEEPGLKPFWKTETKVKASNFFKKETHVVGFEGKVYQYLLGEKWPREKAATKEDWKKLGKRGMSRSQSKGHLLSDKAGLETEIDLHAEKLGVNVKALTPGQILELQLKTCEDYLNRAIMHGLHQVYLIHGVGKGKLKDAIHELLSHYPQVVSYRNEFHPKYGYGATEVNIS